MRFFIDDEEVTEQVAIDAERYGAARVACGGSGVVPEVLRQPEETREQWLSPWMLLHTYENHPPTKWDRTPEEKS